MAVRGPHHRDVAPDAVESDGAVHPKAFDLPLAFQLHAELGEERDSGIHVSDNDRLDRLERAQAAFEAERGLEDEFALAELRTTGEAFTGDVVSAETSRTDISAAGRTVLRPRFTVRTSDPLRIEPGRILICPARPSQRVQITGLTHAGSRHRRCS